MTGAQASGPVTASGKRRRSVVPELLALAAVAITLSSALLGHVTALGRSGLAEVRFGLPLAWLTQDQSALDPPFPWSATPVSPWDPPASIAVLPLVFDALAVYAVLLGGLVLVRVMRRRGHTKGPAARTGP